MAQFDVYRLREGTLVIDCQADFLADLPTRLVAPLSADADSKVTRLMPSFDIDGRSMTMLTPLIRGIARRDIKETVGSLSDQDYAIKIALDMLITGF